MVLDGKVLFRDRSPWSWVSVVGFRRPWWSVLSAGFGDSSLSPVLFCSLYLHADQGPASMQDAHLHILFQTHIDRPLPSASFVFMRN